MTWGKYLENYFALDEAFDDLIAHLIGGIFYVGIIACLYCLLIA